MKTLNLEIITPAKTVFKDEVKSTTVPGTSGSFQVLYNHAPLISTFEIGVVNIKDKDANEHFYATSGGTIEVLDNNILLLADSIEAVENIDVERAKEALKRAEERLEKKHEESIDIDRAELALARAINRISTKEKYYTVRQ